jgi:predicted GNAT family acetyltransferase
MGGFSPPRPPEWLGVFSTEMLVAWADDGRVAASVGRKDHNSFGRELAVVTDPDYQGRGLARRLIAQSARRVLAEGKMPLYFHPPDHQGSARVAEAAGFPDRDWKVIGLFDTMPS